jgi:hypothetical protein
MASTAIPKDGTINDAEYILKTADGALTNSHALDALPAELPIGSDVIMYQENGAGGDLKLATAQQIADLSSGALEWASVSINTNMIVNFGYITTIVGTLELMLPPTAAVGSIIKITNLTGDFKLTQNAGQVINFNTSNTTIGVGGSITTTELGQAIEMVCVDTDLDWQVISSMGGVFTVT